MCELLERLRAIALMVVWSTGGLFAHDIITTKLTYTRDVSRIFNQRCLGCHQSGSPIPLTTYEEVRPWAVSIKEHVLSRAMPPWGAVKGFGDLAPDHALSQEEILIIAAWVIGGAPRGDPALTPRPSVAETAAAETRLNDGLAVSTRMRLVRPFDLGAIKPTPLEKVESARIIALLPDGRTEPLLWLYQYDPAWKTTFRFREPMHLPAGTEIESNTPLPFDLESSAAVSKPKAPSPAR
jgi:hypothetical protein